MELKKIQKDIWQNKVNKGFNTTDVNKEFCLLYGEVAEAYDAWRKKKDDLNEELADIAIYLMGLSEKRMGLIAIIDECGDNQYQAATTRLQSHS